MFAVLGKLFSFLSLTLFFWWTSISVSLFPKYVVPYPAFRLLRGLLVNVEHCLSFLLEHRVPRLLMAICDLSPLWDELLEIGLS